VKLLQQGLQQVELLQSDLALLLRVQQLVLLQAELLQRQQAQAQSLVQALALLHQALLLARWPLARSVQAYWLQRVAAVMRL